jgi:acetyl esterase/lipase
MKFFCSLLFIALLPSIVRAADPTTAPVTMTTKDGPAGTEIIRDMEIARVGDDQPLLVDIARPRKSESPMPAVLCVHGGGWSGGSKDGVRVDLAMRGYFVVSVGYRLAGKNLWPAQIQDCKLAVRWIRANAAKFNVNPDKIGAIGHSAGGHLVACLGTMAKVPGLDVGPYPGVSSEVQAVVDYAGPTDLAILFHHKSPANLFGPNGQEHPELMDKASPIHYVSSSCPPFFIAQGDHDRLVPQVQADMLAEALKKAGVPVEYIVQKNGGHSLGGLKTDPPCAPTSVQLREMTQAFLDKNLKQ